VGVGEQLIIAIFLYDFLFMHYSHKNLFLNDKYIYREDNSRFTTANGGPDYSAYSIYVYSHTGCGEISKSYQIRKQYIAFANDKEDMDEFDIMERIH